MKVSRGKGKEEGTKRWRRKTAGDRQRREGKNTGVQVQQVVQGDSGEGDTEIPGSGME